ncbi:MAG TPA: hypothetical protein VGF26_20900, partial [Ramlibacter sp.]
MIQNTTVVLRSAASSAVWKAWDWSQGAEDGSWSVDMVDRDERHQLSATSQVGHSAGKGAARSYSRGSG